MASPAPDFEKMVSYHPGEQPNMTLALHGTSEHCCHSHTFPIFQTSTFLFDNVEHGANLFAGKEDGYIYTRLGNPTVNQFEKLIAKLEGGNYGLAFGSGMGAISSSVWPFLKAGDHVIWGDTLYGCTVSLFETLPKYGIDATPIDVSNLDNVKKAIKPNTKMIYLETPANPTCKISDIKAIVDIAKEHKIMVVVDNTFTSPIFQRPLELGADICVNSVTKYINGHGDVVGGCATCKDKEIYNKICAWRKDNGSLMAPFDAFLVLRGLRTLPLRMHKICENGLAVARFLEKHPKISKVYHPGLESFPQHDIAVKQMSGYGSTFSFEMAGGFDAAKTLCTHLHVFSLAVSLGCNDSLIEHPASMTHACVPAELMAKQGLTPSMVRVSVGLEEVDDLIADLENALKFC